MAYKRTHRRKQSKWSAPTRVRPNGLTCRTAGLLAITRVTRNTDGRPFEFSYDLFRADRVRLTATMTSAVAQESRGVDGKVERVVSRLAAHRRPDDTLLA